MKTKILKNKWYRADIMERWMSRDEQQRFEDAYQANKTISLGRKELKKRDGQN